MKLQTAIFTATLLAAFLFAGIVSAQLNLDAFDALDAPASQEPAIPVETAVGEEQAESTVAETASTPSPEKPAASKTKGLFAIIHAGGLIGYLIILLSLMSVALMIEHAVSIRRKTFMPPGFADEILALLSQGQLVAAIKKCEAAPGVLARILHAGMTEYELGWAAVEKGAEEATAEEASRLYRKIEYLNVIGNIAPMLGLLGTVVGMIFAFQQLADSEGYARAADLAEGIYQALVTTVEGLIVAIPSLAAFSIFSNRIAFLIAETTFSAEQVLFPIKKSLMKKGLSAGRP